MSLAREGVLRVVLKIFAIAFNRLFQQVQPEQSHRGSIGGLGFRDGISSNYHNGFGRPREGGGIRTAAAAQSGTNAVAAAKLKDPDLLLKSHRLITDKSNGAQYITGTIKNISQYRYLAVKVNFALLDATGQVIPDANVSAYIQTIEPGKDWAFKVLLLDPDAETYRPLPPVEGVR
jgi:hypothetical protein